MECIASKSLAGLQSTNMHTELLGEVICSDEPVKDPLHKSISDQPINRRIQNTQAEHPPPPDLILNKLWRGCASQLLQRWSFASQRQDTVKASTSSEMCARHLNWASRFVGTCCISFCCCQLAFFSPALQKTFK